MPFRESSLAVDLNFEFQEGMIGDRGVYVIHEFSILCPCMQSDPTQGMVGHSDPTCSKCFGQGYLFKDPVRMHGLVTGLSNNRMWAQVGWIQPGDLSFSPSLKARRISDFDKVTLTVSMPTDSQVIVRGTDTGLAPRSSDLAANEDLLYWEAGRPEAIWIEDEDENVYHPGQYRLEGRRVVWAPGGAPPIGKRYSIKYEAYPEFIAWVSPMERWDRNRELGQRVMLRRALIELNPARRQIKPPWQERIQQDGPDGTDDPYTVFGENTSLIGEFINGQR